ncbi:hypothetical protein [Cecembia lonarensis]|uniref:Uncharacterized protein n=1 Tax=Cecembia lonarensis (strain CCUG 58316 / KCTC 22772 / LW9) TaxID=1225176 RepID=K1KUL0_CECL9|nr:hypothetical protein [Cecembia lonarensis]EKB47840.1 hypothetical protein B879_03549 [Cecembia lonarensis LW9]
MKTKRISAIFLIVALLLSIPFIAMQFTEEVQWSPFDFILMGVLLSITGLGIDLILRKFPKLQQRLILIAFVLGAFFLIWAELAVGIFGSPFAGS